ncbi:MAG: glycosyltransferase family 2 protein [Azonexus sp.]
MVVVAVVVTYEPDATALLPLLDSLVKQVAHVVVVDNGSTKDVSALLKHYPEGRLLLLPLDENRGIAAAQNLGIRWARQQEASHVILFDHDSRPASDMVANLLASEAALAAAGHRVASIGPRYTDDRQDNPPPFIRVRGGRLHRCLAPEVGDSVNVDYLIASGCLIPINVLDVVGGMAEELFIDYVDIEWGLRARSKGYENFGCFSAMMSHSLGDEPITFLGAVYPVRSPLRHYYMFRNAVLLYRMAHIPAAWKWADGLRGVLRFGFYVLFAKPRRKHLQMMLLGLLHGLRGKTGKLVT